MSDELCVICRDRPAHGAYGCVECLAKARRHLTEIGDLLSVALDVAYGQTARAQTGGGGGGGEPRLELNLAAKARLDAVGNALTTWARHVAEERGVIVPTGEPIATAVAWLLDHCEWQRHREDVDRFVTEIGECAAVIRGLAAGPRERVFLGPCGAMVAIEVDGTDQCGCDHQGLDAMFHTKPCPIAGEPRTAVCDTPLYGRLGASKATCRTCGAEHVPDQRIAERTALAHSYRYTAVEIEKAYPGRVHRTNIGRWRKAGLLEVHGEIDGYPLYEVAEVLALTEPQRVM